VKNTTKSPIKDKPLRSPGQALEEERQKLIADKLETPFLIALFSIILAAWEWSRYINDIPPRPVVLTIIAALIIAYASWRFWRMLPRLRAIKQGIEGEKAVGQYLERLRKEGYQVFHDLLGDKFNVDHVLIGPAGIFTIETKTWSKPARGEPRIRFDGARLTTGGREPSRSPVIQAHAQASWLKGIVSESTGKPFDVFPVVLFPGWFIECAEGSLRSIWVLEPKGLPKFLENAPVRLSDEDINLASYHLSRFIRGAERERSK